MKWRTTHCCDGAVTWTENPITFCSGPDPTQYGHYPDGHIGPSSCGSPAYCTACEDAPYCDGTEATVSGAVDSQCGDDEHECGDRGRDENPVHYDTGVAETTPRTLFAAPGNEGLSLGYSIQHRSHAIRPGAGATLVDPKQDRHFLGHGWIDTYADRIIVPSSVQKPIVWQSLDLTVTFPRDGTGLSRGGKFALLDNGAGQVPRWVVKSRSPDEVKRTWEFKERVVAGWTERVGLLHAMTSAAVGVPGFRVDVARVSSVDERINIVSDNLGRQLRFYYLTAGYPSGDKWIWRLDRVAYRPDAAMPETNIANFQYGSGSRLSRVALPVGYLRFNYFPDASRPIPCIACEGLLTEVIAPVLPYASTPAAGLPAQSHELVMESHEFEFLQNSGLRNGTARVKGSRGPSSRWAYHYEPTATVQLDLLLPKDTCPAQDVCPSGQACWQAAEGGDDRCYIANVHTFDNGLLSHFASGGAVGHSVSHSYDAKGRPRGTVAAGGAITSYGYDDTSGEISCLVRNDNDYDAFTGGVCLDSPPGSGVQVVKVTRSGGLTTQSFPSHTQPGQFRSTSTVYGVHGLAITRQEAGWTRDIDGNPLQQTRTSQREYDSFGRVSRIDGPMDNAIDFDVTDFVYYDSADNNRGQMRYVRRYLGTASSHVTFQTEYLDYDVFGFSRRVVDHSGVETQFSSSDRVNWSVSTSGGGLQTTVEIHLNPDGTLRSSTDADGVCLTMSYDPYAGLAVVKRSAASASDCGQVPINTAAGEVEVREHVPNDPSRPLRVTRRRDGVVVHAMEGFQFDDMRQLVSRTVSGTTGKFEVGYEDGVLHSVVGPDWPSAGNWKSEIDSDVVGRPTALRRYIDQDNAQTATMTYASAWDGTPTGLQRGMNQVVAQTSAYVYDDFGALLESTLPDSGISRWQQDVGGRVVKERVAHGQPDQRTSVRRYDSLGRVVEVDHDTEHPVDCSVAPDGTPIYDEEYVYDSCVGLPSFTCAHAIGRLAISRVLLHCSSGSLVATSRWYQYDALGRLDRSRSVTEANGTSLNDGDFEYTWTDGGRLEEVSSPLNAGYGSRYGYSSSTGLPESLSTSLEAPVLEDVQYEPFGGLLHYSGVSAAGVLYSYDRSYRMNGELERNTWLDVQHSTVMIDEEYQYSPSGSLLQVEDHAHVARSRRYDYDNLLRLTCERAPSAPNVYPACDPGSPYSLGVFSYHNGEDSLSPPDHRATAFLRGQTYTSSAVEEYRYVDGANRSEDINRGASGLVFSSDSAGRREFEYESSNPTNGRQEYTYLPNGRLGAIHGRDALGSPFAVVLTYGVGGRLSGVSDSRGDDYQLYWDDQGRLSSAMLDIQGETFRWHFHYLGHQPVAATREQLTGVPTVQRFYLLQDRRGLIAGVVDDSGALHYSATYSAHASPSVAINSPGIWLPFLLPGQIEIPNTGALDGRLPLVSNGERVYSREMGAFLTQDPADPLARRDPEGYAYARNNPLSFADPTGMASMHYWDTDAHPMFGPDRSFFFNHTCSGPAQARVTAAIRKAIAQIEECVDGACGDKGGEALKAHWLLSLSTGEYACIDIGDELAYPGRYPYGVDSEQYVYGPDGLPNGLNPHYRLLGGAWAETIVSEGGASLWRTRKLLTDRAIELDTGEHCITRVVAHESLHGALATLPAERFHSAVGPSGGFFSYRMWFRIMFGRSAIDVQKNLYPNSMYGVSDRFVDEGYVRESVDKCVGC